jgi:hypothetical protein
MGQALGEAWSRLLTCWYVLRGHAVVRSVSVSYGEVTFRRLPAYLSDRSVIDQCKIWTPGPVRLVGNPPDAGNEGDALL